jgi:hypothetical protein
MLKVVAPPPPRKHFVIHYRLPIIEDAGIGPLEGYYEAYIMPLTQNKHKVF